MIIGISSFCWECFNETEQTPEDYQRLKHELNSDIDFEVELNDKNLYEFICPKKHRSLTQLQEQKFEILFDIASLALLDGYTKEAVSTYSSSLERFFEYCILVFSLKNSVKSGDYDGMWNLMAKQSERQLGAFLALCLQEGITNRIVSKKIEFRNDVIHKGYTPSSQEAIDYGQYVLSFIQNTLKELNQNSSDYLQQAINIHLTKNTNKIPKNVRLNTASMPTIISLRSLNNEDYGNVPLIDSLNSLKENGFYKHFYRKKIQ
ncbi:hypothetical protein [Flavobacterium sp. SORGH_AS_0622]|uniref:hypothetical protein n=1 Tax=Flavobacterium sp. SORGH_AS_0622 TaxID=3041772 RepID=UPI0027843005|nr:hypothetical protein [Flavobacterium sp. SORGH_AS_0622]MDQ1163906.1 hypothetical protein [Flavobacterium sp. SORGH_AS_0622]